MILFILFNLQTTVSKIHNVLVSECYEDCGEFACWVLALAVSQQILGSSWSLRTVGVL